MNTNAPESEVNWLKAVQIPQYWTNVSFDGPDLRLCHITYQELTGCPPLVVPLTDSEARLHMASTCSHPLGQLVKHTISLIPAKLNSDSATLLLHHLAELKTCTGNPEPKFIALGEAKKHGQFLSAGGAVVAYFDSSACVTVGGQLYPSTVRFSKCHLLTKD